MASLIGRLVAYARTPQGRRLVNEAARRAQELAKDPATRARVDKVRRDLAQRRQRPRG